MFSGVSRLIHARSERAGRTKGLAMVPALALKIMLAGLVVRMDSMRARKSEVSGWKVARGRPPGEKPAVAMQVAIAAKASLRLREGHGRLAVAC